MILQSEVHDGELDSTTSLDLDRVDAIQAVAVVLGVVRRGHGAPTAAEVASTRADELGNSCRGYWGGRGSRSGSTSAIDVVIDDVGSPEATPRHAVVGPEGDQQLVPGGSLNGRQGATAKPLSGSVDIGHTNLDVIVSAAVVILDVHVEEGQRDRGAWSALGGK